jgi:parallel beta-helix repeat protein
MSLRNLIFAFSLFLLAACNQSQDVAATEPDFQKKLQTQLIQAEAGDIIEIPEGTYHLKRSLSLNVDGVTIKGAGMNKTILSFKSQISGAEGLLVNASGFTLQDIAIEDSKGDALKVNEGKNIVIRRVRTEWTNGPDENNGAYGIYPVQTENLLIEDSVAIGASDAGIYVGQSKNIIIRNNRAEFNVAGIEIENSTGADVYGNVATNNTGGILVFNLPNLPVFGHSTRVYNNQVFANNTANFAPEGNIVAGVPAGTGIMINSNDKVEVFGNELRDNDTAHILITAYYSSGLVTDDKQFDPYPETILIGQNIFEGGGTSPDNIELKALKTLMFGLTGSLPEVVWDGYVNTERFISGLLPKEYNICLTQSYGFLNLDSGNGNENVSADASNHICDHPRLSEIVLPHI